MMFERVPELDVVFVPWTDVDPDDAVRLGATWLRQQPGRPLVLLHTKNMYDNNPLLPQLTAGATVEKPQTVWKSGWKGGPVLAPWPSEQILAALSDELARRATSICVIEWGDNEYQSSWLAAHGAVNLLTGEPPVAAALLDPVVEVAIRHLSRTVNHSNGLVTYYEKAYAVRTLQELVRGGYRFDVDRLCAWALANGFTSSEVESLREYGRRVLDGRTFRLHESVGPKAGAVTKWEQEAQQAGKS